MAIITKTMKNGKISVTSDHFENIRIYRQSLSESIQEDYIPAKWRKEAGRDFSDLKLKTTVQCLIEAKRGAAEMSGFIDGLKPGQYDKYKFNWGPLVDYESYDTLCAIRDELLEANKTRLLDEDETKELERVQKEIKDIDDFVAKEMTKQTA